jgi:hypothetical protein
MAAEMVTKGALAEAAGIELPAVSDRLALTPAPLPFGRGVLT